VAATQFADIFALAGLCLQKFDIQNFDHCPATLDHTRVSILTKYE
jgi:hypothetical protein